MRWDIGTVYKNIRKSKALLSKKSVENGSLVPNLSKFESNHSVPCYETMEFLLNQIDMSFGEFEVYLQSLQTSDKTNDYQSDVQSFIYFR